MKKQGAQFRPDVLVLGLLVSIVSVPSARAELPLSERAKDAMAQAGAQLAETGAKVASGAAATYDNLSERVKRQYPKVPGAALPDLVKMGEPGVCLDGALLGAGVSLVGTGYMIKKSVIKPADVLEEIRKPGSAQTAFVEKLIADDEQILREEFRQNPAKIDSDFKKMLQKEEEFRNAGQAINTLDTEVANLEKEIKRLSGLRKPNPTQVTTLNRFRARVDELRGRVRTSGGIDTYSWIEGGERADLLSKEMILGKELTVLKKAAATERVTKVSKIIGDIERYAPESSEAYLTESVKRAQETETLQAGAGTLRNQKAGKWMGRIGKLLTVYSLVDLGSRCIAAENGRDPSVTVGSALVKTTVELGQDTYRNVVGTPSATNNAATTH